MTIVNIDQFLLLGLYLQNTGPNLVVLLLALGHDQSRTTLQPPDPDWPVRKKILRWLTHRTVVCAYSLQPIRTVREKGPTGWATKSKISNIGIVGDPNLDLG
jgi:hypothetical protein